MLPDGSVAKSGTNL
ncbi:hypothetical protein PDL10_21530 [Bacillus cereus]|nr:hypothetical protein [Bacillus cereus]